MTQPELPFTDPPNLSDLAIGMTIAPRPGISYVAQSVASLQAAGLGRHSLQLFAEPDSGILPSATETIRHETTLGCTENWRFAAEYLLNKLQTWRYHPSWFLLVQDDVLYRSDADDRLWDMRSEWLRHRRMGCLSLYTSPRMVLPDQDASKEQWLPPYLPNGRQLWGALALAFPRDTLETLLSYPSFRRADSPYNDALISRCLAELGLPLYVHIPSLCDHIGEVSSLDKKIPASAVDGRRGYRFRQEVGHGDQVHR